MVGALLVAVLGGCAESHVVGEDFVLDAGLDGGLDGGPGEQAACEPASTAPYMIYEVRLTKVDATGDLCPDSYFGYLRPVNGSWIILPACYFFDRCPVDADCSLYDSRGSTRWTEVSVHEISVSEGVATGTFEIDMHVLESDGSWPTICAGEYRYSATPL